MPGRTSYKDGRRSGGLVSRPGVLGAAARFWQVSPAHTKLAVPALTLRDRSHMHLIMSVY